MNSKLIKLSERNYVVIYDSVINDNEPFLDMSEFPHNTETCIVLSAGYKSKDFFNGKKITHSINPLELEQVTEDFKHLYHFKHIKQLSLKDVQTAILMKAIDMAREITDGKDTFDADSISGCTEVCTYGWENKHSDKQIINFVLSKKEWNVNFDKKGNIKLI